MKKQCKQSTNRKILIKIEGDMKINVCEKINNNNGNIMIFGHFSMK